MAAGSSLIPAGKFRRHRVIEERVDAGANPGTDRHGALVLADKTVGNLRGDVCLVEHEQFGYPFGIDLLEDGVNRGPGRDSRSRYIYLHGTNHEDLIGRIASHGCVRLLNRDVTELFERMREGDLVLIAAPTERPLPDHPLRACQRWADRRLTGTRDSWLARDGRRRISNPMSARFAAMKADMVT